ncbi:MAG TPA: calcium/sodium antiporter [Candidatus Krumholzibacteria bacterium]|nr:calcium/sodium antiporter [Candidatus Krumholzibacteria bacterium]
MTVAALIFLLGVGVLVGGAWVLVSGGTRVASALGVPAVVVGLTVVAFGTSAPELFVSLMGALQGNAAIALGNVIGSNVANLGLILALAALLRPVKVERAMRRREVPGMLAVSVLLALMVWDGVLSRPESAALVVLFAVFLVLTARGAARGEVAVPRPAVQIDRAHRTREVLLGTGLIVAGVVALAGGGRLIVDSAVTIARSLGASEALIGLTLVAVGTSLPELATSIVAGLRRQDDLALGNIVGSNIFNILGVAGPVGLVRPLVVDPGEGRLQVSAMVGIAALAWIMVSLRGRDVGRRGGLLLLAVYAAIMALWMAGD